MDALRAEAGRMKSEEEMLLAERRAEEKRVGRGATFAYAGLVGAILLVVALLFWLTLRHLAAREKAEGERDRYFENSLDLLCVANLDGYFKRLNPAWESTLGWTIPDLLSKPWLDFVHPDDRDSTISEAEKLASGVPILQFENRYECRDGTYRWLAWRVPAPEPGSPILYPIARDVTEARRAVEEIRRLNADLALRVAQADAANKELEAFSYSVSHDLRAPLRHASGFVALLQKHASATLDEKGRRYLHTISDAAKKMGCLIDDLLAFSRSGRVEMQRIRVPLGGLLEEVRQDLRHEIEGRSVEWKIDPLPDVDGDPVLLRQVLVNLVSNAVKYTRYTAKALIEIGTRIDPELGTVFYVRDNGAGFDMKYVKKLFGVFQRLHSTQEFEGTGIGLANVRRIIQRHGGTVWGEGRVGEGATFHFTFPLSGEKAL